MYAEDGEGRRMAKTRSSEGVEGVARFHEVVAPFTEDPAEVVIANRDRLGPVCRGAGGRRFTRCWR